MARKRYRRKLRSCGVCKPSKVGWTKRWAPKDEVRLKLFERAQNDGDWSRQ